MHSGRGSDFSDIVEYIPGDDTRDISWKHSARLGTLKKKLRLEEESFPIVIGNMIQKSQWFSTKKHPKSPYEFTEELIKNIVNSASKYHFPVDIVWWKIPKRKMMNAMILTLTSTLEESDIHDMLGLTTHNDLIFIHIFHPYELSPYDDRLFAGLSLNKESYIKEFDAKKEIIKDTIRKRWGDYLMITTDMNIVHTLNSFFKNRYKYN